jgi:hypothetical protein
LNTKRILKITSVILIIFILFFISLAYFGYLDFKKTLITKISAESTSLIGQDVVIGDLSFSPSVGINIYDISIKNPKGFVSGQLLHIKRLYLKTKFSDFFKGIVYFKNIIVYSPELTVIKNEKGRLNVSDKLREFFKGKPTIRYQIDEFNIDSGIFDFNKDKKYRNDNISLNLKNISSESGTKTLLKGSTSYAGSMIRIDGWVYLKDNPRKLNVSVLSEDLNLYPFREFFNRYKMQTEKAKINFHLNVEANSEMGVLLNSKIKIKDMKYAGYNIPWIKITFFIDYARDLVRVEDLKIETEDLKSSLNRITIKMSYKKAGYMDFSLDIPRVNILDGRIKLALSGKISKNPFPLKIKVIAEDIDISLISNAVSKFSKVPYDISGEIKNATFDGTINSADSIYGKGFLKARKISVLKIDTKKYILKDVLLDSGILFRDRDLQINANSNAGSVSLKVAGEIKGFLQTGRSIKTKIIMPEVKITDIRDTLWDIFPDNLLYAGLDGSISSDILFNYDNSNAKINGDLILKNVTLKGENNEYSVGPINGVLPLAYDEQSEQKTIKIPSFEHSEFDNLNKYYSQKTSDSGFSRVTIGSFHYGFEFLENIVIWLNQKGRVLNINHFSGNIFGGMLNGSAMIDISNGLHYRAGVILKRLSLTKLCEGIEPIKGYISGKVDGVANIKGTGVGISKLIGKADSWSYSTDNEKTKISKEFLHKIGGPSLKTYLGDRSFDKGIMSLYLQDGFIIFRELEISNRNLLGMKDLSVKVVPFNNKIAIGHLMWTITEAAQRAKEKK